MSSNAYSVPEDPVITEETIKKSRFITYLAHCNSVEEAQSFVKQIKDKHADARHNCWAFVAGAPNDSMKYGSSDDGEPSGTAGRPMLAQLVGSEIGEICAVVTRYSGGIKLGTGGLVKAYGGGVKQALQQLSTTRKVLKTQLHLHTEFHCVSNIEMLVSKVEGTIVNRIFTDSVELLCEVPKEVVSTFSKEAVEICKGKIQIIPD